ncbi:MAG: SEC-C domain-containing protein [Bacilli bacterium]|nr:SEC-C domain-containing protein [Bacilli bacterium]
MKNQNPKKIFEKYNPIKDVVRCPNGKARLKKTLDIFVKASLNLYGVIEITEFVKIFNKFTKENVTENDVYTILLPNVIKYGWYCFYKNFLISFVFLEDFSWAEYIIKVQEGKPRYIPTKEKFLRFENPNYEDNTYWYDVNFFLIDIFGYHNINQKLFSDIRSSGMSNDGLNKILKVLENSNLIFKNIEETNQFLELVVKAKNNTRIWENKGYTPFELHQKSKKDIGFNSISKLKDIPLEQDCPCGSGKKYKNCCYLIEESKKAQLTNVEKELFYSTWYKLLNYVNQQFKITDSLFLGGGTMQNESNWIKIREKLWEKPSIIGDFLKNDVTLLEDEITLLKSWEKKHIKGDFVLLEYKINYAVFGLLSGNDFRLYAVKGISNTIPNIMRKQLPVIVNAVLLPFKDEIVYDTYISSYDMSLGDNMKKMIENDYRLAVKENKIITKLI